MWDNCFFHFPSSQELRFPSHKSKQHSLLTRRQDTVLYRRNKHHNFTQPDENTGSCIKRTISSCKHTQPTFADKNLIQTYPLFHYSQAAMLFSPPFLVRMFGLLYNPVGTKSPNCCVLTTFLRDEKQTETEKQRRLRTSGNGAYTSPPSVNTEEGTAQMCVYMAEMSFKICKGPLTPTVSKHKKLCPSADATVLRSPLFTLRDL